MRIIKLEDIRIGAPVGGKARGLRDLRRAKLKIPSGFVIIGIESEEDYAAAYEYYKTSGLKTVAIRSSAGNEDSGDLSFAGQYTTKLNISGKLPFIDALKECVLSLESVRAERYGTFFNSDRTYMAVIVQEMVDAEYAGVCFTVDPINRENEIVIEAVRGHSEGLLSGERMGEFYRIPCNETGEYTLKSHPDNDILDERQLERIVIDALKATKAFNIPLDLEWIIDKSGELYWLQARPITSLDDIKIDELDSISDKDCVYTSSNIGDMLPGAATPLSLSTTVRAIDYGLRRMLISSGAYKNLDVLPSGVCVSNFSNSLFLNLTLIYKMCFTVFGTKKEMIDIGICGRVLDTPKPKWRKRALIIRLKNGIKYFRLLFSYNSAIKKLDKLSERFSISLTNDVHSTYEHITDALPKLNEALWYHYITSSHSGAMSGALLGILTKELGKDAKAKVSLASMLEDIEGIESADILVSLKRLAHAILVDKPNARRLSNDELKYFLTESTTESNVKKAYYYFLLRHGHRAVREAEIRSKSWHNDSDTFIKYIRTAMDALPDTEEYSLKEYYSLPLADIRVPYPTQSIYELKDDIYRNERIAHFLKNVKPIKRPYYAYIIKQARGGVRNREFTKSKLIKIVDVIKTAYIHLADIMFKEGIIPDVDLIYFLRHEEIQKLVFNRNARMIKLAVQRRRLMQEQQVLEFEDFYVGKPNAKEQTPIASAEKGATLAGTAICRGQVIGRARIVRTEEDAALLEKGEIMVSPYTDIGFSPYYFLVAGLITEVGSALSHGAVVAREHSLPLVVNVQNATKLIKTGDTISLNAYSGVITILEKGRGR